MAYLIIEGQKHEVDDALVTSGESVEEQDRNLRDALRPNYHLVANATIQREEKDGQLTVTVIKNPGPKGYTHLIQQLLQEPTYINPIYILAYDVKRLEAREELDVETLKALQPQIKLTLQTGGNIARRIATARRILVDAPVVTGSLIPTGF